MEKKYLIGCLISVFVVILSVVLFVLFILYEDPDLRTPKIRIREKDVIGLTSLEIEEKYGKFYYRLSGDKKRGEDGLYRNTTCGYMLKENNGHHYEWGFFITFDENGIAIEAYENYPPALICV